MEKILWLVILGLLAMSVLLGGCRGSSGGDEDALERLVLGSLSADTGNAIFRQTVAIEDSDTYEYFPGQRTTPI